jgi:glycosyltransferase involved in cell wall biosynthesis
MRLLFLAPFLPDPEAPHGGGAYLGHLLAALAPQAEVGLLAQVGGAEMARWQPAVAKLAWAKAVPRPLRPRGIARVAHSLRMAWHWRRLPLLAAKHRVPAYRRAIAEALLAFRPDVALVELAQFLPDLAGVPTVFTDHEGLAPGNAGTGFGSAADRRDRWLWSRYVADFYPRANLLQALTVEDARELGARLQRPVLVRPPVVAVAEHPTQPGAAAPRALFLGDYRHQPNATAAALLARDVLPAIRDALPAAELWLAGANGDRIAHLAALPGVRCLGYQADLAALFAQVRLLLAPVYSGGGFRMKALTALAHGLPVVTNALGARGCDAPGEFRMVAESPAELAAAALVWLRDGAAAARAGAAAHAWVRTNVSAGAVAASQLERVRELLATPRA